MRRTPHPSFCLFTVVCTLLFGMAWFTARPLVSYAQGTSVTPEPDVGHWAAPSHPDSARFITEDITRFWAMMDATAFAPDARDVQVRYMNLATPGLTDFIEKRIRDATSLARAVRKHPGYYQSIRASTERIDDMQPAIRSVFYALEYLYPEARYPDVYFVVGRMNSGGTLSDRALLIGAEMYALTDEAPRSELSDWHRQVLKPVEAIPHIVAHELVHYQQNFTGDTSTLLAKSIGEGSADFIAELISGDHINEPAHAWGEVHEEGVWTEFKRVMHDTETDGWLYGGNTGESRPADLGYYIGYKITEAYYAQAEDKKAALAEILSIRDFADFLRQSGYPQKFGV